MSHWVELGRFCLAHDKRHALIDITTTIALRSADGNALQAISSEELLSELFDGQAWIARGRSFTLEIRITGPTQESGPSGMRDLHWVQHLVTQSELWHQLDLKAVPEPSSEDAGNKGVLRIDLHHQPVDRAAGRRARNHNLSQDACLTDLRPPVSIRGLLPELIVLSVHQHAHDAQSKIDNPSTIASTYTAWHDREADNMMLYDNDDEGDILDLHTDREDQQQGYRHRPPDIEGSSHILQPSGHRDRDSGTLSTSDCQFVVAAVDATLRLALARKPTLLQGGIRLCKDDRKACLQEIAPSLSACGYLKAMFERSCLLPVIGRTLASMGRPSVRLVSSSEETAATTMTPLKISESPQQLAGVRLWTLMHKKMTESACARPLRRMNVKLMAAVGHGASQQMSTAPGGTFPSVNDASLHELDFHFASEEELLPTNHHATHACWPADNDPNFSREDFPSANDAGSMYDVSDQDLLEAEDGGDLAHLADLEPDSLWDEDLPDELMLDAITGADKAPSYQLCLKAKEHATDSISMEDSSTLTATDALSIDPPTSGIPCAGGPDLGCMLMEEDLDETLFSDDEHANSFLSSQTSTDSFSSCHHTAESITAYHYYRSSLKLNAPEDDILSSTNEDIDLLDDG